MRVLFGFVAVCAAVLIAFSFMGALHPAGDSFAVVRVPMVIAFAIAFGLARPRMGLRVVASLTVLAVLVPLFLPRMLPSAASDYDYVLYQQNLLFIRQNDSDWLGRVAATQPDMMTLQEVSGRNKVLLAQLAPDLPTQVYCDFASVGGVAVLSRYPSVSGTELCADRDGLAGVQLDTPHGPVWLVSIHLHWPWPYGQAEQVRRLVAVLDSLEGHVIIGGDFNAVAWSNTIAQIEQASRTTLIGPNAPTFHVRGVPIGIDHVLTGPAYTQEVQVVAKYGSDHHGLIAYLTRPNAP